MAVLTTLLELMGLLLLAVGAGMVFPPAGVMVAGAGLLAIGVALAPRAKAAPAADDGPGVVA